MVAIDITIIMQAYCNTRDILLCGLYESEDFYHQGLPIDNTTTHTQSKIIIYIYIYIYVCMYVCMYVCKQHKFLLIKFTR